MNSEINVEEIMEQIRQNMKDRGYDKEPLSFDDIEFSKNSIYGREGYNSDFFQKELEYLNQNWNNPCHVPVTSSNFVFAFIKKVIRKCTYFIILPIINFQNAYNASNTRCMNQIKEYMVEIEKYKLRIETLEQEIESLKGEKL